MSDKMRTKNYDRRKQVLHISLMVISALFCFFRFYSLLYSFLRKFKEWAYTEDYTTMIVIPIIIWVILIIVSVLFGRIIYGIIRKLEKWFAISTNYIHKTKYVERLGYATVISLFASVILNIIYFLREYTLADYISKDFGTISALAYNLLDWMLFNLFMTSASLVIILGLFLFTYKGMNPEKYQSTAIGIVFLSLTILTVSFIFSLGLFYWINTFTIETWFA